MPLPMLPYADAGPLYGCVPPSTISVSLTPGSAASAGAMVLPLMASANTAASMPVPAFLNTGFTGTPRLRRAGAGLALLARGLIGRHGCGAWGERFEWGFRRRLRARRPANQTQHAADDPVGDEQHHEDQGDAVHHARRGVVDLLRDQWEKLDDERPDERAPERQDAAEHRADEQRDRQREAERVGADERRRDGKERAGDAGQHRAPPERERLVVGRVDAERDRRDRVVAQRAQRPPD